MEGSEIVSAAAVISVYMFFSICVVGFVWSRHKNKTEIQKTLRRIIDSEKEFGPEVIDAIRRDRSLDNIEYVRKRARSFKYWGIFLVALGAMFTGVGFFLSDYLTRDGQEDSELIGAAILFLITPGLFCLAQAFILKKVHDQRL